jgi:hypothetical protein
MLMTANAVRAAARERTALMLKKQIERRDLPANVTPKTAPVGSRKRRFPPGRSGESFPQFDEQPNGRVSKDEEFTRSRSPLPSLNKSRNSAMAFDRAACYAALVPARPGKLNRESQ